MAQTLRVLIVEDSSDDAELLLRELRRGGYAPEWQRVQTQSELRAALEQRVWDIVFADYSLPRFSAPEAFAVVKELQIDVPFIIVSGTVGEETAVAAMRSGVHDYILKDKLTRLIAATERELREATSRAERRRMQERLFTADRMVSVGTLAAGVAHEINGPLATLMLGLELSLDRLAAVGVAVRAQEGDDDAGEPGHGARSGVAARIAEIEEGLRYARDASEKVCLIAQDLKAFSWAGTDEPRGPVEVQRVLESSLRLVWNEIRYRSRLVRSYGTVPAVLGSEPRLGQVFLNLLLNAAQSIPEGQFDRHEIHVTTRSEDGRVVVEIGDTGAGIAPEYIPRIFEPFFTTKPFGVGTGLGLTICQQIVSALGGEIQVTSELGKGTQFRVSLPAAEPEPRPEVAPIERRRFEGRAMVLVVDDDPVIGNVVRRIFSDEHDVRSAVSVEEALSHIAEPGARFDLILCDMHMTYRTGMDLHAALQEKAPELASRIAFMIGGAVSPATRDFLSRIPNPRLEKPFDAHRLRAVVRQALAR